jgi:hypothetical protein
VCTGTAVQYAFAVTASRLAFHEGTEYFDRHIMIQEGDPTTCGDVNTPCRGDEPPTFRAPAEGKFVVLTPPQKVHLQRILTEL